MTNPFITLRQLPVYLGLSLAAFASIFPFFWMLVGTTNSAADIIRGKASFGDQFGINFANFFAQVDVLRVFWNSASLAIMATVLTLVVSSMAGYGFEMFRSKFRERVFAGLLLMLAIPFAAIMVPLFVMMAKLGLINTYAAIILPGIASIFIVFYFRQCTKAFPSELRDAARIAGQSRLTYASANWLRRLRRNASLQPACFSFIESDPLDVSLRARSRARRRRMAMLAGPLSLRLRAASSRNETSSCQCRAFSISQWARTVAMKTSGAGIHDSAKWRISVCAVPSTSRW